MSRSRLARRPGTGARPLGLWRRRRVAISRGLRAGRAVCRSSPPRARDQLERRGADRRHAHRPAPRRRRRCEGGAVRRQPAGRHGLLDRRARPLRGVRTSGPTADRSAPNLGLIKSADGGRNWDSVSLLGEADFQVLESQGDQVYGFDGAQGRLTVSRNGGKDWTERRPPTGVFALAIDPQDARSIVASTERGVFTSADEGATWCPRSTELAGLLSWPAKDRLLLMDATGTVQTSEDGGRAWRSAGSIGSHRGQSGSLWILRTVGLSDGSPQDPAAGHAESSVRSSGPPSLRPRSWCWECVSFTTAGSCREPRSPDSRWAESGTPDTWKGSGAPTERFGSRPAAGS